MSKRLRNGLRPMLPLRRSRELLRRLRILSSIAIVSGLIGFPAGPVNAGEPSCDATCEQQQVTWYLASLVTQERTWYGAVIWAQPATQCVMHHESRFNALAENPVSTASGLVQFVDGTWSNVAYARGRADLVGHASNFVWYEQLASFWWLWTREPGHWTGTHC